MLTAKPQPGSPHGRCAIKPRSAGDFYVRRRIQPSTLAQRPTHGRRWRIRVQVSIDRTETIGYKQERDAATPVSLTYRGIKTMKSILAIGTSVLLCASAQAQTTCQTIGTQRICNNANGTSSTTQRIGNQAITNYSDGQSATTQRIGNQNITNYSSGQSATSQQIGNQRITNYSNGVTSTTQQIGNQTITNFSDGRTVTCQTIGSQRICN